MQILKEGRENEQGPITRKSPDYATKGKDRKRHTTFKVLGLSNFLPQPSHPYTFGRGFLLTVVPLTAVDDERRLTANVGRVVLSTKCVPGLEIRVSLEVVLEVGYGATAAAAAALGRGGNVESETGKGPLNAAVTGGKIGRRSGSRARV